VYISRALNRCNNIRKYTTKPKTAHPNVSVERAGTDGTGLTESRPHNLVSMAAEH